MKRSQQKRITKEATILRYMRISKKLSLNDAGRLLHISGSAIAHIEGGRMDVSKARIETMVGAYGYTVDDYLDYLDGKELPINMRDECHAILKQLDETRLQAVYGILVNFLPPAAAKDAKQQTKTVFLKRA